MWPRVQIFLLSNFDKSHARIKCLQTWQLPVLENITVKQKSALVKQDKTFKLQIQKLHINIASLFEQAKNIYNGKYILKSYCTGLKRWLAVTKISGKKCCELTSSWNMFFLLCNLSGLIQLEFCAPSEEDVFCSWAPLHIRSISSSHLENNKYFTLSNRYLNQSYKAYQMPS